MAKTLQCKIQHFWGESVVVGDVLYTVGKVDGIVEVSEEHAAKMLQNAEKWADASTAKQPFKRPTAPPQLLLVDGAGMPVPQEEADKLVAQARTDAEVAAIADAPAPPIPVEQPLVKAEEPAPVAEMEPEPAPSAWPEVSTKNTKAQLLEVLSRLASEKKIQSSDFSEKMTKNDLLEVIERAYDAMS